MSDPLVDALIADEGLRFKPYTDTRGKLTIGVGRNLTDVGITSTEAMLLLEGDLDRTRTGVRMALPWFDRLNASRQRVLLNMAFNLGVSGLLGFKQMLADCQAGDYDGAANEMLASVWASQVGQRAVRLAQQMRTGQG